MSTSFSTPQSRREELEASLAGHGYTRRAHIIDDTLTKKAQFEVIKWIEENDPSVPDYHVFLIWFTKTLQNWKACVSTTLNDDRFFEITYNGDKCETYIDVYYKGSNVRVSDTPIPPFNKINIESE